MSESISVIVPTRNAGPGFRALLQRIWEQTTPPSEIIVIDTSSSDGTLETATAERCRVETIQPREFDHGGTRNYGLSLSRGSVVVFTVQDAMPLDTKWLSELVDPIISDSTIAATSSRQVAGADASVTDRAAREVMYPETALTRSLNDVQAIGLRGLVFSDASAAYRKAAVLQVGGFRDNIIVAEDIELAFRLLAAGYRVGYVPSSRIQHSHNYSISEQFQRNFDMGVFFATHVEIAKFTKGRAGLGSMGLRYLRVASKLGGPFAMHRVLADAIVRTAGLTIGKHYRAFARLRLAQTMSRSKSYWDRHGRS